MESKRINRYNIKFFRKNNNAKNTLLCVHGYNSSSDFVKKLYDLDNQFNIISINLPGSKYVKSKVDLTMEEVVHILEKFIKKLRRKNIYFLAHSLAGAIVTEMKDLSKIKGYVFLDTLNPYVTRTRRYKRMWEINSKKEKSNGKILNVLNNLSLKTQNLKNERIRELGQNFYFFTNPPIGLRKIFKENMWNVDYIENELHQNYKKIKKPVLAICGLRDIVIDYRTFSQFMKEKFKVESHLILNGGHNPINDSPKAVNKILNDFIGDK